MHEGTRQIDNTFWKVITAMCLIATAAYGTFISHTNNDMHAGVRAYVQEEMKDVSLEIRKLREALISRGMIQPETE
tara:strand:- start:269 stop:496 length:228 start_codon:yes stop_codon:yes gene_type:complete